MACGAVLYGAELPGETSGYANTSMNEISIVSALKAPYCQSSIPDIH